MNLDGVNDMDEWISVDNSLPQLEERVLICLDPLYKIDHHEQIGVYAGPDKLNIFKMNGDTLVNAVTYWMKLPALPK